MTSQRTHRVITVLILQPAVAAQEFSFHNSGSGIVQVERCDFELVGNAGTDLWSKEGQNSDNHSGSRDRNPSCRTAPPRDRRLSNLIDELRRRLVLSDRVFDHLTQPVQAGNRGPACHTLCQVSFCLDSCFRRQLTIYVEIEDFSNIFAVHYGFLRMNASGFGLELVSLSWLRISCANIFRPRFSRDITVPIGHSITLAISS